MNYHSEQKIAEGYLQKQKRRVKNGQISIWRYFKFSTLDKDRCFTMKVKQEDNSTLKTYNAKQIKGFTDKLTKEENIFGTNRNFSFKIITTIKPYVLSASNKEEFQIWMKTLQKFTEANSNQNSFTNFSNKYISSNSIGQTQVEFQGLQVNPININSSTIGNISLHNNSKLKNLNNLDGILLNNSSKQDNSFGKKQLKNFWDAEENDSEEERDIIRSRAEAILNKNIIGNANIPPQNGNFESVGNFGTFGSNKKLISGPNSSAPPKGNQPSVGSMKNQDNNINRPESEDKNSSYFYPKSSATYKRESSEKNQIQTPIDSFNLKNNNSIVNSCLNNYSVSREEKIISRQREVGLTNNSNNSNNNIDNSINNKYQPNIGKFEILGETPNYYIIKNIVFEGINKREEKGIIPLMENVKPLTTITGNQFNSNSIINNKIREGEREQTSKSSGADYFKIGKTNFIVEFSGQDFFEVSPLTPALAKKEEFDTLQNKQQSANNNSNSMSIENSMLKFTNNENKKTIIKEQSKQNYEKYQFISEDVTKLQVNTDIYTKNQISTNDKRFLNKTNNVKIESSEKLKVEESKRVPENQNPNKSNYISEDLSTDFPKLKTKSDIKKENISQENDDLMGKINISITHNIKPLVTIFDENLMHIKQGLNSTSKTIVLENLSFCPTNIYNDQEKPARTEGNNSHSPQVVNTKRILSSRKQGFKEELKMQVPNRDILDSSEPQGDSREINFSVKQNMINKILGTSDTNTLYSKSKRYINTNVKKSPKDFEQIGSKNMIEVPNIDYIQPHKNAIKVSLDKFALKKDLNHMNVQNTYQLDAHTVLQDEFHMPMDKVVNFQHKQTQVYDYNDQTRSNIYLSNIHADQSIIVGGFGDMDSDKTFLEEINKINQIHLSNSYSLLDVDEDWNSIGKNKKENYDSRFEI